MTEKRATHGCPKGRRVSALCFKRPGKAAFAAFPGLLAVERKGSLGGVFRSKGRAVSSTAGKRTPAASPRRRFPPAAPEAAPTRAGPALQPRSPARASREKRAVPPAGIRAEAKLKEPGHRTPTENPQSPQPARARNGRGENAANR